MLQQLVRERRTLENDEMEIREAELNKELPAAPAPVARPPEHAGRNERPERQVPFAERLLDNMECPICLNDPATVGFWS